MAKRRVWEHKDCVTALLQGFWIVEGELFWLTEQRVVNWFS